MFKRRNKKTILSKIKNSLWPDGGWKRYGQYLLLRLSRLKGTPSSLAAGLACGVAISFTPFVGFHFVLAALTAFLFRGNILASALGTAAGNPWTFPFIWMSVFYTGRKFLGVSADMSQHVDFLKFFEKSMRALMTFDFSLFFADIWPILWPMMIGCIPFYLVSWFLTYYLVKGMLIRVNTKSFLKKEEKL